MGVTPSERQRQRHRRPAVALATAGCLTLACVLFAASPAHAAHPCHGLEATIEGTAGDDILTGTPGPDVIFGYDGNDLIVALGGNDHVCAGDGDDIVYGDAEVAESDNGGNDYIYGEDGNDILIGDFQTLNTTARGGVDYLHGGGGDDFLYGTAEEMTLTVGATSSAFSEDTIHGGSGADHLYGQARFIRYLIPDAVVAPRSIGGNTWLDGGAGADFLYGDFEHVVVESAGPQTKTLSIEGWSDIITAGDGADTLYGDYLHSVGKIQPTSSGMNDYLHGGLHEEDSAFAGPGHDTCANAESVTSECEIVN